MAHTTSTGVVAPQNPRKVASKVDLSPIAGCILAVWVMISSDFVRYPLGGAGEDALLRDHGVALLMLFVAVSWARARTHRRRFLAVFALLSILLIAEAVFASGLGQLSTPAWNELVSGVLGLLISIAGWRSAGRDRPPPSDTSEVANLREP
jgi:hypothetical protein